MDTTEEKNPGSFPGQGGNTAPPDPRSEALKYMLLTLQDWIGALPKEENGYMEMETSKLLSHNQAVGMWLTQLEQFGMMLQGQEDALARLTNIATEVQMVGERIGNEIDARIPVRSGIECVKPEES